VRGVDAAQKLPGREKED
jgi:hypothetical protein